MWDQQNNPNRQKTSNYRGDVGNLEPIVSVGYIRYEEIVVLCTGIASSCTVYLPWGKFKKITTACSAFKVEYFDKA